jgi:hypothetical protein
MKKTFPLKMPGRADARVVEAIKSDVRKYVKRERRKTLPEGFSEWAFACKAGASAAAATSCKLADIGGIIDAVASAGGTEVYVEILAAPSHRAAAADSVGTP